MNTACPPSLTPLPLRMTEDHTCDFAVIGGGSAGYAAARTAAALGLRTTVIDGAEELGGLCILRGCMPSKTLIQSANTALRIRRAAELWPRESGSVFSITTICSSRMPFSNL